MTGYSELVKALRSASTVSTAFGKLMADAADAIEELQDMPWVESVQIDKLRQRIDELEETACHCNVRENAELIAKILDDDVDGKVYQMPKRGKWLPGREISRSYIGDCCVSIDFEDWRCSICGNIIEIPCNPKYKYCPNCGAKMEVQE